MFMPMSKWQVSTMMETEHEDTLFSMIQGKLQECQINTIQMYNMPKIQVTSIIFCMPVVHESCKLCLSVRND